jgi:hypothetical protein
MAGAFRDALVLNAMRGKVKDLEIRQGRALDGGFRSRHTEQDNAVGSGCLCTGHNFFAGKRQGTKFSSICIV